MTTDNSVLVLLRNHNEVDQMSPVLYKMGERGVVSVDIVLKDSIPLTDYRISTVTEYDNISIYGMDSSSDDQNVTKKQLWYYLKGIGRKLPTKIPEKVYSMYNSTAVPVLDGLDYSEYSLLLFDWTTGKSDETAWLAERDGLKTVVFPHGDSPFENRLETRKVFQQFVDDNSNFATRKSPSEIGYQNYENMLKHDFVLFPNEKTASRITEYRTTDQVQVLGSPRFNQEWIDVLSGIKPSVSTWKRSSETDGSPALNAVFFLRPAVFFISEREVKSTLNLLNGFSDVNTVVKEHPRNKLLDPSVVTSLDNVSLVGDNVHSSSLIEWGDFFLSLGTTITFEPVMKRKPVLGLEYAHANHTILADYFPNADMRSKEELYQAIHDLLEQGTSGFYNEADRTQFVEEMITNSTESVLDDWAEFVEREAAGGQSV